MAPTDVVVVIEGDINSRDFNWINETYVELIVIKKRWEWYSTIKDDPFRKELFVGFDFDFDFDDDLLVEYSLGPNELSVSKLLIIIKMNKIKRKN